MPGQKLLRGCVKNDTKINTYTQKMQDIVAKKVLESISAWEYEMWISQEHENCFEEKKDIAFYKMNSVNNYSQHYPFVIVPIQMQLLCHHCSPNMNLVVNDFIWLVTAL